MSMSNTQSTKNEVTIECMNNTKLSTVHVTKMSSGVMSYSKTCSLVTCPWLIMSKCSR